MPWSNDSASAPIGHHGGDVRAGTHDERAARARAVRLGALRLGRTRKQAEATGLIEGWEVADYLAHCGISQVKGTGAEVFTHPERGVSFITLYGTVRTPEGVRLGSSLSAVRAACQLDYREVAGHLGIPEGTVKSRIHQARGHVRESLTRGM